MRKFLSATMLATSLIVAGGAFTVPAFAEVVYNRGSAAEPESRRSAQDLDCLRGTCPARPVRRSGHAGCQGRNLIPGAAESWTVSDDGKLYTFKLRQGRGVVRRQPGDGGRFRLFSFRRLEDPATAAEYASMLYVVKNAEEVNTGKAKLEDMGVKAVDANTFEVDAEGADAIFPRNVDAPGGLSGQQGLDRQARRRLDQARQSGVQWCLHARGVGPERPHQDGQEPEVP